jgi:hypothetical protein
MLTLKSRAYVWPTLLFLGVGFALANGMGYGDGNLRQYLLHALHALDPGFLAADWFTAQTRAHHVAFNVLIVGFGRVVPLEAFFGLANAAFALLFAGCVYWLAVRFHHEPMSAAAVALAIWALGPTSLLGMSAIINSYFQPSTIGAVGLLAGLTCLTYERYRLAGLILFVAALFHINYAVWISVIVASVLLFNGKRMGLRRSLFLACPVALAVTFHVPFALAGRTPGQDAALASHVLHDIYMPCHSRPRTWGVWPFVQFGAAIIAGVIALAAVRPAGAVNRVTVILLATLGAILGVGMLLTAAVQVDTIALLFPFRLSPFLVLAAYIAVGGAIAASARLPVLSPLKTVVLWIVLGGLLHVAGLSLYVLSWIGAIAAAMLAGRLAEERAGSVVGVIGWPGAMGIALYLIGAGRLSLGFVGLGIAAAACWRWLDGRRLQEAELTPAISRCHTSVGDGLRRALLLGAAAVAPLVVGALLLQAGAARKDLLGPPPPADEQTLYDWCRAHTKAGDVFVIPPQLGRFRLGAGRAVIIDWKCMPILPDDTVKWYRRLMDECGVAFENMPEAEAGFASMDAARARRLGESYGARYLVIDSRVHRGDLAGLPRLYSSPGFTVFDLRQPAGGFEATRSAAPASQKPARYKSADAA